MSAVTPADKTTVDVSIVLISHETCAATLSCLSALPAAIGGITAEIIVVDNASSDGSADAIARHETTPWLISCGVDHGFRKAAVLGATMAMGRYVLVLRSDAIAKAGAVARLVAVADRASTPGIWGGRVISPEHDRPLLGIVTRATVTDTFLLVSNTIWPTLSCFDRPAEDAAALTVWANVARLLGHTPKLVPDAVAVIARPTMNTSRPAPPSLSDALKTAATPDQGSWLPWRRATP